MFARECIERKRDGVALSPADWSRLMTAYAAGDVPDYQMAALAMAIWFRGMDAIETASLMRAMLESGARLDFAHLHAPRVDKHSTGGVGDKTSLILAPLIAACGVAVPMMSGRGLGHTGGTLDKLEAIPGFRTDLSLDAARRQVEEIGCVLIGQTGEIAPADKRLYALRDATATVESIPLIAASIMSKKLAEGLTALVLDVKFGSGAFMPQRERALELTQLMVSLGAQFGVPVRALLTAMDRPLGRACGNALEVEEAIMVLRGEGPADLIDVTMALGEEMLIAAGVATEPSTARQQMEQAIGSGRAAERFEQIIAAQGGDPRVVSDPSRLPQAEAVELFYADRDGIVLEVRPRDIGIGITALGGGRTRVEDVVDPTVGFVISARPGQIVRAGEPLATVFAKDATGIARGTSTLRLAIRIGDGVAHSLPLIAARVTSAGVEELAYG
jgi:pyrimidine-nucleoside phosphorylase